MRDPIELDDVWGGRQVFACSALASPTRHSTDGRFLQIPTLPVGKSAIIRSIQHPEREVRLRFLQACLIPACFGEYEFVSPDGSQCTVMAIRPKEG